MIFEHPFQPYVPPSDQLEQPTPSPTQPVSLPPIEPAIQPITWLWPGRIPAGKLTLLDGSPGCGTTLFAITLAACVSNGLPFPDGLPCVQGNVLFIAPHDNFRDTLLPRLHAAGAHDGHVMSLSHVGDPSPTAPQQTRPFSLSQDLAFLESMITSMGIVLLILDPYTALPGWRRALPALVDLAQRTHCAILLTRSLSRAPADPLYPHCPASPVLTAARSHLLLAPDPADERHCLLLTPKHSLCAAPSILAYTITTAQEDIPTIHWLPAPDPTHLRRLATGPIRSPQRQAILRFLREQPAPYHIKDILAATSYDYEAGRKMLVRMQHGGELISLGRGLYTTSDHPCLAHSSPVPVPTVPDDSSTRNGSGESTSVGTDGSYSSPMDVPAELQAAQNQLFDHLIARGEQALAEVQARLLASGYHVPIIPVRDVPCPDPPQTSPNHAIPTIPSFPSRATIRSPQTAIPTSQTHTD